MPYLAVVALPPICAAVTIYAVAGRSPTLPAPIVLLGNQNTPPFHPGIRSVPE